MNIRFGLAPFRTTTRTRLLLGAGLALPLTTLSFPAYAEPVVQDQDSDIVVNASSASGLPTAVELSSGQGTINATITNVTGSATVGDRGYVIGMETLTDGNIVANFGTVTAIGQGQMLGIAAETYGGAINLTVGTVDVSGSATAGISAYSESGAISIDADRVIARGTGVDSEGQFLEAVQANSRNNSVDIKVGHAETYGQSASAIVATAGGVATVTADTVVARSEGVVVAYADAAGDASVEINSITLAAAEGQGAFVRSNGGNAALTAGTVNVGDYAQGARVMGAYDANVDVGTVIGGSGLRVESTMGDISVSAEAIEAWAYAINAQASGGDVTIEAGTVASKNSDTHTVQASTTDNGGITFNVEQAEGAGADRVTLLADTQSGDIAITAGSVVATGDAGVGIAARTTSGNITVDVGRVASSGRQMINDHTADGVYVNSINGTATVTAGTARAEGYAASALVAIGGGGAVITADEASSAGQFAAILYASSAGGDAKINAGTVVLRGDQQTGINALATRTATVSADSIFGQGTFGAGLYAEGGAGVSVVSGTIDVERYGIRAAGLNASDVAVVTSGNTLAETGYGIYGSGGNVEIHTAADSLTRGATFGIRAVANDSATIDNRGTAVATGGVGSAVHVSTPGTVVITSNAVEVTGPGADPGSRQDGYRIDQGGIIVDGGAGAIAIDASRVAVDGEFRYGISARGNGTIDIVADELSLTSADSVAVVARGGAGDVSITTGNVITTGASGVGVFGHTTSGAVTLVAGSTRVENGGTAGQFTGDALVGTSDSGRVSIQSQTAYSAGGSGSAIVAMSGGDVAVISGTAQTTGDGGVAIYAQSSGGNAAVDSGSVVTSGLNARAIGVYAGNGAASAQVGNILATGAGASGVLATGREANIAVTGQARSALAAISAQAALGTTNIRIDGSVVSDQASAVVSVAQNGQVKIGQSASVQGALAGVRLVGGVQGGSTRFENSGVVTGTAGPAVVGASLDLQAPAAVFHIRNDGTLVGGSGAAIITGAGDDVLELTDRSRITGVADLGDGEDRLVLGFNDNSTGTVGQVVSTLNVERLSVESGTWRADDEQSFYDLVEIEKDAVLAVGENAAGLLAVEAASIELSGKLNLDLSVDEAGFDMAETNIVGTGSLHLIGTSTVELTGADGLQHTGGTFVENGELLLTTQYGGDIGTSGRGVFTLGEGGDFTGNLVNDGTFVFAQAGNYDFLGDFGGSGLLRKQGAGRLTFAGLYSFDGETSVLGGTVAFTGQLDASTELDLSADGAVDLSQVAGGSQTIAQLSGDGGVLQLGSARLVVDQGGNTAFAGELSGTGALVKDGSGNLKLNGDGSGFTGTGQIDGGTLSVNGSFGNTAFEVNPGGKLGGSGTVGNTIVQGGTLGAGNSIGTLNVAGDLTFTSGSILEVEVDPAGNADRIDVSGRATLGGAAVNVLAASGTYRPLTDYTILTATGGIAGTFGSVQDNLAFLDPSLIYSANAVTLRLVRNDIDFAAYGATPNQVAIANLIESFGYGNGLYNAGLTLIDGDVAPSFASLTGDVYPAYASATIETAELLRRQTAPASGAEGAYAWATGLYGQVDGGTGAGEISLDGRGVAGGFGVGASGFSATAGLGFFDLDRGGSQSSGSQVTFAIGQVNYASPAGFSAHAGAQIGWVRGDTRRQTTLGTIDVAVTGALTGDYLQVFGEVAYKVQLGSVALKPFAGISRVSIGFDELAEAGGATALTVGEIQRDVNFANVGVRISGETAAVRPFASAAYRTAWGDRASTATVGFASTPGTALIGAIPVAESAGEFSAGLAVKRGPVAIEVQYDGLISSAFDSHGISAGLKFHF